MKNILNFLILTVLPLLASCSQELPFAEYLNLDKTSYTFNHEGGTLTVKVDANIEWTVNTDADWVKYEITGNDVIFTTEKNEGEERFATVSFTSDKIEPVIIKFNQLSNEFSGEITYFESNVMMKYSPKGLYTVKIESRTIGGFPYLELYLINNNTQKVVDLDNLEPEIKSTTNIIGISDNGHVLYTNNNSNNSFSIYYNNQIDRINLPSHFASFSLSGISSDGNTIVGTGRMSEAPRAYIPFKCTNGVFEELLIPETNAMGEPLSKGISVGGMSDDGSVIWGYDHETAANYTSGGLVYWKNENLNYIGASSAEIKTYNKGEKEYKIPCLIRKQGSITSTTGPKVSPNGRYILAEYYDIDINNNQPGTEHFYPVKIDVNTGEYTIFKEYSDMIAYTITDEGEIFGASPFISVEYIAEKGIVLTSSGMNSINDYFLSKHGIIISNNMLMNQYIPEIDQYIGMKYTGKTMYGGQYQNFTIITK